MKKFDPAVVKHTSTASTPVRRKDYIIIFIDSPRSGARFRALAIVGYVRVDRDRVNYVCVDLDHTAPDES
jgi:hypothetical protein